MGACLTRRDIIYGALAGAGWLMLQPLFNINVCQAADKRLPDRQNPIVIDGSERTISIYTEINIKNLQRRNPHWGIVARSGRLQDRAILKAFCEVLEFHDALIGIGAVPGNNLTEDRTGATVEGDILEISAFWEGGKRPYSFKDIFEDTTGRGFLIRFGGNKEAAQREKTGCITCLESCWIAITSNSRYPNISNLKRTLSPSSNFKGNGAVLPNVDGHPVIVRYRLS